MLTFRLPNRSEIPARSLCFWHLFSAGFASLKYTTVPYVILDLIDKTSENIRPVLPLDWRLHLHFPLHLHDMPLFVIAERETGCEAMIASICRPFEMKQAVRQCSWKRAHAPWKAVIIVNSLYDAPIKVHPIFLEKTG